MNFNKRILIVFLLASLAIAGCKLRLRTKGITEGTIKYKITYIEDEKSNPIISLLPSYLTMSFKDQQILLNIEGWMGIFKSSFIKDKEENAITLLKILNKKYLYKTTPTEGYYGMSKYDSMCIVYDNQVKKILDFECQHAVVKIPCKKFEFDVYYTDQINILNPNANTPLNQIPGVLLEFQVEMNGILMHLEASEFIGDEVPDNLFAVPEGYLEVQKAQMDEIFKGLM